MKRTCLSIPLAAMSAMYTSGFRTDFARLNAKTFIDDGSNSDAGGTDTNVKTDELGGEVNKAIDDVGASTGQMQAQTSDAVAPGTVLNANAETGIDDANKVNDGSDAGLASTAIGDPPAGQTQQV